MAERIIVLAFVLLLGCAKVHSADNLVLNETFESQVFPPVEWTVKGTELPAQLEANPFAHWGLNWNKDGSLIVNGAGSAVVESYYNEGVANISKEEWLISPAVKITQGASLSFTFCCNASSFIQSDRIYGRFLVKVSTDNGATWHDLWNAASQEDVENSGLSWPWNEGGMENSNGLSEAAPKINLQAYVGQTIKIAFYFQSFVINHYTRARLAVDDVRVGDQGSELYPEAEGTTSYEFFNSYIGYPAQSVPLTIRNSGYGTLTVSHIEGLDGTDFSTSLDPATVALEQGEKLTYRVYYTPTLDGASSAVMKINTNGGPLYVNLKGTKVMLEEGFTLESFESDVFPPAGWTLNTGWHTTGEMAASGIKSVTAGDEAFCEIVSPRLNLSDGAGKVKFDYIEMADESYADGSFLPSTSFICYYKTGSDPGWTELWRSPDDRRYNEWMREEIEIRDAQGNPVVDDEVYLRWTCESESGNGVPDDNSKTRLYFDNVVLPQLYGIDGIPMGVSSPIPSDGAVDVDYIRLALSWAPAQFADGYELSVGTNRDNPISVLNHVRLEGNTAVSRVIPELAPNTTYYWRVVPYNSSGKNEQGDTWSFTTMADQSISRFPYTMNFDAGAVPPKGWKSEYEGKGIQSWGPDSIGAFAGEYSASVYHSFGSALSTLTTPEIALPATDGMVASFAWGRALCTQLYTGYEDEFVTELPIDEVDDDAGTLYFEIKPVDTDDWIPLAYTQDSLCWRHKYVLLDNYAGKRVNMRWRFIASENTRVPGGASLDEIYIGDIEEMPALSVGHEKMFHLTVYPNPTTGYLRWSGGIARVTVYDLVGNCVMSRAGVTSVSLHHLPAGVYLVTVARDHAVVTVRVVKY